MEGQEIYYSLSFSEEVGKKLRIVLQCIFGRDFLSLQTTLVLGIENHNKLFCDSFF